jgi:hypothetical protein
LLQAFIKTTTAVRIERTIIFFSWCIDKVYSGLRLLSEYETEGVSSWNTFWEDIF